TPGRRDCRERQRIGSRSGGDREHPHRGFEQFRKPLLELRRPLVGAIAERGAAIGANQRVENFRRGAAGIVAPVIDHRGTASRGCYAPPRAAAKRVRLCGERNALARWRVCKTRWRVRKTSDAATRSRRGFWTIFT